MSIRYTRACLEANDEELKVLLPGFVSSVEETKKKPEVRDFLRENLTADDVTLTLRHYLFGDECAAYDADVNHLLLLGVVDEMGDACLPRSVDGLAEEQVGGVTFTLEQEAV